MSIPVSSLNRVHKTRYSASTGIYYAWLDKEHWQHLEVDEGRAYQVGPIYVTKAELLTDHERFLKEGGFLGEND